MENLEQETTNVVVQARAGDEWEVGSDSDANTLCSDSDVSDGDAELHRFIHDEDGDGADVASEASGSSSAEPIDGAEGSSDEETDQGEELGPKQRGRSLARRKRTDEKGNRYRIDPTQSFKRKVYRQWVKIKGSLDPTKAGYRAAAKQLKDFAHNLNAHFVVHTVKQVELWANLEEHVTGRLDRSAAMKSLLLTSTIS